MDKIAALSHTQHSTQRTPAMTRVLLVEDNAAVLESIALDLELRGYNVLSAIDGYEALNLLRTTTLLPDIIVSDIAMPRMDGYEFLQEVQQDNRLAVIPFIFLTAYGSENDIRHGKRMGVDDYLTKPFRPDDLVVAMESKLKRVAHLNKAAEEQLDKVREDLLHMISHELRTPLTSIYGGVAVLSDGVADIPKEMLDGTLMLIRSGVRRMNRLVDQILFLVQVDNGKLAKDMLAFSQPCNLTTTALSATQLVEFERERRAIKIEVDAENNDLFVHSIPNILAQVIAEVIRNAVLFSGYNESVLIDLFREGDWGIISVRDNGQGILEEDIPHIFTRFRQSNRQHQEQQGAGLGLSIVRDFMNIQGGAVSIQSLLGQGTEVQLRFPLLKN